MQRQSQFLKLLQRHDGRERDGRQFERWVTAAFCALARPMAAPGRAEALEAEYQRELSVVGPERMKHFSDMLSVLTLALEESGGREFLSAFCHDLGVLHEGLGQFFTPWDVSIMMAEMTLHGAAVPAKGYLTIVEPACGFGAMVLAAAQVSRKNGLHLHTQVWFESVDISQLCARVAFIQMALAGCSGLVRCANTLDQREADRERTLTPMSWMFLQRHRSWPGDPDRGPGSAAGQSL